MATWSRKEKFKRVLLSKQMHASRDRVTRFCDLALRPSHGSARINPIPPTILVSFRAGNKSLYTLCIISPSAVESLPRRLQGFAGKTIVLWALRVYSLNFDV